MGCILGELFTRRPIFPFADQLAMVNGIFSICGSPTKNSWPEVKVLPGYIALKPQPKRRILLEVYNKLIPTLALDLLDKMLCLNPAKRITAEDALKSTWIQLMDEKKVETIKLPVDRDCHEMNAKTRRKKRHGIEM